MILAMKTVVACLYLICLFPFYIGAEEKISFHQISKTMNQKPIEISGFIYPSKEGETILAPQPDLRSCCVGSSHRLKEQIVLNDLKAIPVTKQPVTMRGILHINSETGQMSLSESETVVKRGRFHLLFAGAAAGAAATFFLLRRRYRD